MKNQNEIEKEFNLSEKIDDYGSIHSVNVKEFIRLLKRDKCYCGAGEECVHMKTIDKLAGDKLI